MLDGFKKQLAERWGYVKRVAAVALTTTAAMGQREYPPAKSAEMLAAFSGWVYACVKARARDVSRIELKLYKVTDRKTGEVEEVEDHEVLSLLRSVNPFLTFRKLIEHTQAYKDLQGEAFWWLNKAGSNNSGMITQIWPLRPDYMTVQTSTEGFISGYEYKVPGAEPIKFRVDEIIHHKEFDPKDPYRGMGVVKAAAVTIDSENYAEVYNKNFFRNSAVPEIVLSTDKSLTDDQVKRMTAAWSAKYQGTNNAHKIAILEGGLDVKPFSISQKDMEFLAGLGFSRDKILALFEMPKSRLGMTEGVTVSNAEATIIIYLKYLVKPLMEGLRDDLNEFLLPMYAGTEDMFFEIEDPVPADVNAQITRMQAEFAMGAITPNEVREEGGRDQVPGLDTFYLPLMQSPIAGEGKDAADAERDARAEENAAGAGLEPVVDGEGKRVTAKPQRRKKRIVPPPQRLKSFVAKMISDKLTEDIRKAVIASAGKIQPGFVTREIEKQELGESNWTAEQKSVFWKSLVAKTDSYEKRYKDVLLELFNGQEKRVLAALGQVEDKSIEHKFSANEIESILISVTAENKIAADLLMPLIKEIMEEVGNDTLDFIDPNLPAFDSAAEGVKTFLRTQALKGIRVMNKVTKSKLRKTLMQTTEEGAGPVVAARRIRDVFEENRSVRAIRVARTETLKAANRGTLEAYKQSKVVVGKQWLTAEDEAVCQWCGPMDKTVLSIDTDFFDQGTTFLGKEGGVLNLSYDAVSTPPLHPNCRCTIVPITIGERAVVGAINKEPGDTA